MWSLEILKVIQSAMWPPPGAGSVPQSTELRAVAEGSSPQLKYEKKTKKKT